MIDNHQHQKAVLPLWRIRFQAPQGREEAVALCQRWNHYDTGIISDLSTPGSPGAFGGYACRGNAERLQAKGSSGVILTGGEHLGNGVGFSRQPMDHNALTFHATKPGFLTLGKLMYGAVQFLKQIVAVQLPLQVMADETVFQTVKVESLPADAGLVQGLDLLDHALFETLPQTLRDPFPQQLTGPTQAENFRL